jgi:adenosylcobinamide-GDP ribazoletransferase
LQFLTVVPPVIRRPFTPTELGRAVGWFALIGLLLGAALAGADQAMALLWPNAVTAALLLVVWVLATGALHLDGLLDTCDGIFGGHIPETRLRIMRDERVGAYAVIGAVLVLLVKYACLAALTDRLGALLTAPTLGRAAMALAVVAFPYARPTGLGRDMKDNASWWQAGLAGLTALVIAALAAQWLGLIAAVVAVIATCITAAFAVRRVQGLTGDVYGALCELVEVVVLLTFVAGERQ